MASFRSKYRTGRPYLRERKRMFQEYGTRCHLCGHYGATQADHVVPVSKDGMQLVAWYMMRPAHGNDAPCRTCGRACNQSRGNRKPVRLRTSRAW